MKAPPAAARRSLVRLAAAVAGGRDEALDEALREARAAAGRRAVEEVVLQSYLFLGFPAALWALGRWRDLEPAGEAGRGEADGTGRTVDAWRRRGEEVCRRVYGRAYGRLRRNVSRLHPDLDRWMVEEGYGKVLGRPGLALVDRELCIVAMLGAGRREPPLHSHLRGAWRLGATAAALKAALEAGLAAGGADPAWEGRARALWERVRAASGDGKAEREDLRPGGV